MPIRNGIRSSAEPYSKALARHARQLKIRIQIPGNQLIKRLSEPTVYMVSKPDNVARAQPHPVNGDRKREAVLAIPMLAMNGDARIEAWLMRILARHAKLDGELFSATI